MGNLEKATDVEIALGLACHIEKPCIVEVRGVKVNPKEIYIREAGEILPTLKNPYAIDFLGTVIRIYS